jgi:hypothetical protein
MWCIGDLFLPPTFAQVLRTYSYELQASTGAQRLGLGRKLMEQLSAIRRASGMRKVMLTVQKGRFLLSYYLQPTDDHFQRTSVLFISTNT